jgi:hypothetical protein
VREPGAPIAGSVGLHPGAAMAYRALGLTT